jgi:hypothetical protein
MIIKKSKIIFNTRKTMILNARLKNATVFYIKKKCFNDNFWTSFQNIK